MGLTDAELLRVRTELGYHALTISAEPYIGLSSLFSQVIAPYLSAGSESTSSTPVTAATAPTPQSLVLADATGFHANDIIIVDVDARAERATVQAVNGSSITVMLSLSHGGVYPVIVEGGVSIVRDILRELDALQTGRGGRAGTISSIRSRVGIKRAEDIEFFGGGSTLGSQGVDPLTHVHALREHWRDELASVLGIPRLNAQSTSGGGAVAVF